MGWADLVLGKSNPFASWADSNPYITAALGSGLASGQNFESGLSNAVQGIPAAKQAQSAWQVSQQAEADRQKAIQDAADQKNQTLQYLTQKFPDLAQMAASGAPVNELWGEALKRMNPAGGADMSNTTLGRQQLAKQYGLEGDAAQTYVLTGKLPGSNQSTRAGVGQPVYGKNKKTGEIVPFEPMTDGTIVNLVNPQDAASNYNFDPATVAFQRAAGTTEGRVAGGADAGLPIAAQTAQNAINTIQQLKSDEKGMDATFGHYGPFNAIPSQIGVTIPGSDKANYGSLLEQAKGQAFLNAYAGLRNAGAISDAEGQKAGAAVARINNPNIDKATFKQALDDYEAVLRAGYARLQQQAAKSPMADPSATPQLSQPTPSGYTVLSVQ